MTSKLFLSIAGLAAFVGYCFHRGQCAKAVKTEVKEDLDPLSFTMPVVLERVRKHGDLFAGVLTTKQRLTDALKALGG